MRRYSFTKEHRILDSIEFKNIYKQGKTVHSRYFLANVVRSRHATTRLGITVSKKVGGAVTRNRIKRVTREYFRKNRHGFLENLDVSIVAKKAAGKLSNGDVSLSLQDIFKKISKDY